MSLPELRTLSPIISNNLISILRRPIQYGGEEKHQVRADEDGWGDGRQWPGQTITGNKERQALTEILYCRQKGLCNELSKLAAPYLMYK